MELRVDVAMTCKDCNRTLEVEGEVTGGELIFRVSPCTRCLEGARKEGHEEGREEAESEKE